MLSCNVVSAFMSAFEANGSGRVFSSVHDKRIGVKQIAAVSISITCRRFGSNVTDG